MSLENSPRFPQFACAYTFKISRYALTVLQPYNITTSHHCNPYNLTTLQPYNLTALQPYIITTLQQYNPTGLQPYSSTTLHYYNLTALQPYSLTTLQPYSITTHSLTTLLPYNLTKNNQHSRTVLPQKERRPTRARTGFLGKFSSTKRVTLHVYLRQRYLKQTQASIQEYIIAGFYIRTLYFVKWRPSSAFPNME